MTVKMKNKRKTKDHDDETKTEGPPLKKSKRNGAVEEEQSDKTPKPKSTPNFDIKHFRKDLYNVTNRFTGLTQFLHVCLNPNSSEDYILKYLENGGSPGEIVKQLEGYSQKDFVVASTVFKIFHLIIEKIQSAAPHLLQSLEDTCRYFLSSFAPMIEITLNEKSNPKQQKVTLEMLTSIVTLNSELALTVLNQLTLQPKTMGHLIKYEGGKSKDNVRSCLIRFLLSFLIDGSSTVIKNFLNKQGLLASIIPDLIKDNADVVLAVLKLLKTSILENNSVSKTLKTQIFSHQIISNIFNLFNWKRYSKKSEVSSVDQKHEIEKATDEILFVLFTSHKYGVYFIDKSLGIGEYPKNKYLWKAIEMLSAPWNNDNAGKCLIKILNQCPDFYKPIRTIIEETFDDKHSELWFKTVKFTEAVFLSLNSEYIINSCDLDSSNLVEYIKCTYLPASMLRSCLTVLKSGDTEMKKDVVILLQTILKCLKNYLDILECHTNASLKSVWPMLKKTLEDVIPKAIPSINTFITTLHKVLDSVDAVDSKEVTLQSKLLLNTLDFLLLYNEIIPNTFEPVLTTLDTKVLFDKIEHLDEDIAIELKLKMTKFFLCADRYCISPEKPLFKEVLPAMFEVLTSDDVQIADSAYEVLNEILTTTGVFEGNRNEIHILLYTIRSLSKKYGSDVSSMIVDLLNCIIGNNEKYEKKLSKLSRSIQSNDLKFKDNIETLFDNLEKYDKRNEKEICLVEDRPFISYFIFGLLKNSSKYSEEYASFKDFYNRYIICLLHYQDDSDRYIDLFSDSPIPNEYIFSWKSAPIAINKNVFGKKNAVYKISDILLNGAEMNIADIFGLQLSAVDEETTNGLTINLNDQTYIYEKTCINRSELMLVFNSVLFHVIQLHKLNLLDERKLTTARNVLFAVLEICSQYDVYSKRFYLEMVKRCFGNDSLLANFEPFIGNRSDLTDFVLDIVNFCNEKSTEKTLIDMIYKPYRHKIYLFLSSHVKLGKGVKFDNVESVLSTLKMDVNDALSILSEILKLDVACMETETSEASSWINIVCHAINLFIENRFNVQDEIIVNVAVLYSKIITQLTSIINVSNLEQSIYEYLLANSRIINDIPSEVFEAMFNAKHSSRYTSKLGGVLLKSNVHFLSKFLKFINDDILNKREFIIPMTVAAFHHSKLRYSADTLNKIYSFYKPNIMKIIEKPQKATQIYVDNIDFIVKLIYNCMEISDCEAFLKKVHKFDCTETYHMSILESIFFKFVFSDRSKANVVYFNNFLLTVLQLAIIVLKKGELNEEKITGLSSVINRLISFINDNRNGENASSFDFESIIKNNIWQSFYKFSLKSLIECDQSTKCSDLLGSISELIDIMYPVDNPNITELFDMLTSHSEFLNVMLNSQHSDTKKNIISLLAVLVSKNKNVMKVSHIPVYLSAYQATRHVSDRRLLELLNQYENSGHSMTEYRPYLWSDIGANYFALKSTRKKDSLWSNPTVNHVLNLFDKETIVRTIKYFPVNTKLNSNTEIRIKDGLLDAIDDSLIYERNFKSNPNAWIFEKYLEFKFKYSKYKSALNDVVNKDFVNLSLIGENQDIYDPAFILPLLNYVVAPGSVISCHRILRLGVLAIPLMALSSNCPLMRSAAFSVLHRFYTHLEAEVHYKNDKLLWTQFLDTIINSMNSAIAEEDSTQTLKPPRLPPVCALYLARSALVMTSPLDPLFKPVNNFVILKQFINFSIVPDLLDLFHNNDITFTERRIWILKVIRDGIRNFDDIKVLLKSVAFKILLDFYSCTLADTKVKGLILDIITVAVSIPKAAKILIDGYGLLPWLNTTFKPANTNKEIISKGIHLVDILLLALTCESSAKILSGNEKDTLDLFITGKCFKINEVQYVEILLFLLNLMDKLHLMQVNNIKMYLSILVKLSITAIKQMTSVQILKLIKICEPIIDPGKNFCKTIILTVKNGQIDVLSSSMMLMNSNEANLDDSKIAIYYLSEIVSNWLS